jgi:hypothetical protein
MWHMFLNLRKIILLLVISMSFFPIKSFAFDFFVILDAMQTDTDVASVGFKPSLSRFGGGVFFIPGVALELQDQLSSEPDHLKSLGVGSEIDDLRIIALRFQSPYDIGYSAFVKLGRAQFDLLAFNNSMPATIFEEELTSGYFSAGLQKQVDRWPRLGYSLSYEHLYRDERVRIRGLSFSYSYFF